MYEEVLLPLRWAYVKWSLHLVFLSQATPYCMSDWASLLLLHHTELLYSWDNIRGVLKPWAELGQKEPFREWQKMHVSMATRQTSIFYCHQISSIPCCLISFFLPYPSLSLVNLKQSGHHWSVIKERQSHQDCSSLTAKVQGNSSSNRFK